MKKVLFVSLVAILTLTTVGCGCDKKGTEKGKNKKEETVVNTEKEVIKDQKVEVFKMTNTSLTYDGSLSTLVTEVTNTSKETQHIKTFNIIVKDKDGKQMVKMLGYIGEEIPGGESRTITSSTNMDISKAASVEYSVNR